MTYELLPTLFIVASVLYAVLIRCVISIRYDDIKSPRYRNVISVKLTAIAKKASLFFGLMGISFILHEINFKPEFSLSNILSICILSCYALYCVMHLLNVHKLQLEIHDKALKEQDVLMKQRSFD